MSLGYLAGFQMDPEFQDEQAEERYVEDLAP